MREARFFKCRKGIASVEFAIVLPIFLLFLFGIIQFGFIMYIQNNMMNAARETARRLSVDDSLSEAGAVGIANAYLANWPMTYSVQAQDSTTTGSDFVRVRITAPMAEAAVVGDIIGIFGTSQLAAEVVMREEG